MENNDKIWEKTLGELELLISKANFTTWFKNTFVAQLDGENITVGVPNAFTKVWLEKKYHKQILSALENVLSKNNLQVIYRVITKEKSTNISKKTVKEEPVKEEPVNNSIPKNETSNGATLAKFGLNPQYTFDTFVVGPGNELAQAASHAAANKPGEIYNPLFIYGGVGLGKTHLVQAVGNYILSKDPSKKVLYINSEKFTNDFIFAIKSGQTDKFKQMYRNIDVLLIDDIQFIAGKEQTQEEFFHTFNALHQNNKQIVISSDRPPKAIQSIENRLISRFEWGMIADISSPDLETRVAILEIKAQEKKYKLDKDIIHYVAENIQENIRELEGALNRIIAFHQLNNTTPSLDSVKSILGGISANHRRAGLTPKKLLNSIAGFYDISMENLLGASRKKELVVPRQIAMFLMREELKASYPNIGRETGNRDHTTAMHACIKITTLIESDEKIKNDILVLRQKIYE
ncbi:MAG: chromosomal replication initiator protein DnaA [Candidatus Komeilibacteria bacterium]|nr:chromosomal replication initiator protein DnaA [Candidatus Komeilibacteria bacterium]MBT4447433.1 chromosomal replication initiator protein DnaA [Candidatus Komeilibacteria bacterium]